ncbi:hypothetical protein ABZX51_006830 [Aspergillus tubingensis]|uniref:kinesin light chain n=1 Tax=Aspergillus tubingensis TaxID=5068 RepID=UPI0015799EA5|nr:kinesin light chain [Aspergillus tubingensis]GFN13668.1 kinesin light chain [Aspergillus tubingensis]
MARRLSHHDYTAGWVCALPDELTAAQEMLDEEHQNLPPNHTDSNIYTLGSIGAHNVVLACLPAGQTGNNSAAAVAMQMKSTFPDVRFGLMVGIGGGAPSKEADIRLGDVVVSQPGNGHGGVVQYDFGKSLPGGFKRTGFLNTPPMILLAAVTKLRSNLDRRRSSLSPHLSKLSNLPKFSRDQAGSDVLFEAEYNHAGEDDCVSCTTTRTIQRKVRADNTPMIHYGTIASGNQVMKDGVERDKISFEFGGVLCFEMEAAGLMNTFPCLVIRGICDYADSHKNKIWQPYAAGTAAAYAKELLGIIPAPDVVKIKTVSEALNSQKRQANGNDDDLDRTPSKRRRIAWEDDCQENDDPDETEYEGSSAFDELDYTEPDTTQQSLQDFWGSDNSENESQEEAEDSSNEHTRVSEDLETYIEDRSDELPPISQSSAFDKLDYTEPDTTQQSLQDFWGSDNSENESQEEA